MTTTLLERFSKRHRAAAQELAEARTLWAELCQQSANGQEFTPDDWAAVAHAGELLGISDPPAALGVDAGALRSVQSLQATMDSPEYHLPQVMTRIETNRDEERRLQDRLREVQRDIRVDSGAIQRRMMMLTEQNAVRAAHPRVFDLQEGGHDDGR